MAARLAIPALAIACAVSAVLASDTLVDFGGTSYSGASPAADVADAVAGLGLVLAGALAWMRSRTRLLGLVAMLAGLAWLAPDWTGWNDASPVLRSVGAVVSPFYLPLLLHLALAVPSGRLGTRFARFTVAAVYALAAAVSVGLALFRDPFLDPYCWQTCSENAFLVHAHPGLADTLGDVWTRAALGIGAAIAVVATRRLAVATATAR